MKEFKCLVDEATAKEIFALPSSEFERHIKIRTIANDGTLTMRFIDNEQPKPRTGTEYENVGFHKAHEAMFEHEMKAPLYILGDFGFEIATGSQVANGYIKLLYRKVEKEIDWCEGLNNFLLKNKLLSGGHLIADGIEMKELRSEFIKMCRLVESLTRHIEV